MGCGGSKLTPEAAAAREAEAEALLSAVDTDGDGAISADELRICAGDGRGEVGTSAVSATSVRLSLCCERCIRLLCAQNTEETAVTV